MPGLALVLIGLALAATWFLWLVESASNVEADQ